MKLKSLVLVGLLSSQLFASNNVMAATVDFPDTQNPIHKTVADDYKIVIEPKLTDNNGDVIVPVGGAYTIIKTHSINDKGEEVLLENPIETRIWLDSVENVINIPADGVYEIEMVQPIPGYEFDKGYLKEDGSYGPYRYVFPTIVTPENELDGFVSGQVIKMVPKLTEVLGDIEFTKTDAEGNPLKGAEFKLEQGFDAKTGKNVFGTEDSIKMTFTSGEDGLVSFKDLPEGLYQVVETKAPKGYELNNTPMFFQVSYVKIDGKPQVVVSEFNMDDGPIDIGEPWEEWVPVEQ